MIYFLKILRYLVFGSQILSRLTNCINQSNSSVSSTHVRPDSSCANSLTAATCITTWVGAMGMAGAKRSTRRPELQWESSNRHGCRSPLWWMCRVFANAWGGCAGLNRSTATFCNTRADETGLAFPKMHNCPFPAWLDKWQCCEHRVA